MPIKKIWTFSSSVVFLFFQIILSGSGSVPEHSYPGKVGSLSSVDPNPRDSHTYTVTSGGSGKFKIFGTDLWAMTQFDFESPPNR